MDLPTLVIRGLTLAYLESHDLQQGVSKHLLENIYKATKQNDKTGSSDQLSSVVDGLRSILKEIIDKQEKTTLSRVDMLQRIKLVCGGYSFIVEAAETGMVECDDLGIVLKLAGDIRGQLTQHFREADAIGMLGKAYGELAFRREKVKDFRGFISQVMANLEPVVTAASSGKKPGVVECIDLSQGVLVNDIYLKAIEEESDRTILKLGKQGLNMLTDGGLRRGEMVVTPALQHGYKSSFNVECLCDVLQLNRPSTHDAHRKPLILRISFENKLTKDMLHMFRYCWLCKFGVLPNMGLKTPEEMAEFIHTELRIMGWEIIFMQVNPSAWTYRNLFDVYREYEALGYEIVASFLDYLPKLPITGCDESGGKYTGIQDLYEKVRNFGLEKDILHVTPHQLNSAAKAINRDGLADFLEQVNGHSYYKDSTGVAEEVDLELTVHRVKKDGKWYLGVARGKHRNKDPLEHPYAYWEFPPKGPIPRDIDGEPTHMKRPGMGIVGKSNNILEGVF